MKKEIQKNVKISANYWLIIFQLLVHNYPVIGTKFSSCWHCAIYWLQISFEVAVFTGRFISHSYHDSNEFHSESESMQNASCWHLVPIIRITGFAKSSYWHSLNIDSFEVRMFEFIPVTPY